MHSYFLLFKTCSLKHIPMGEFCSFIANAELCCFCVPSDVKVAIILIDRAYSHNVSRHVHNDVTPTQTLQWKNNYLILIHLHEPNIWLKTDKCVKIFGYVCKCKLLENKTNKIRDLFKVKLYTIRSETKKKSKREREKKRERDFKYLLTLILTGGS